MRKNIRPAIAASPTNPPTTPPAIAPVLEELDVEAGLEEEGDGVEVVEVAVTG